MSHKETVQVVPLWELSIPLPAVLMITLGLYMVVLGLGLWIRSCLKDRCSPRCAGCCPDISLCEQCFRFAEMCACRLPTVRCCRAVSCPSPSPDFPRQVLTVQEEPVPARQHVIINELNTYQNSQCTNCDCACTCQPPECDTCNCLCFEIRIK